MTYDDMVECESGSAASKLLRFQVSSPRSAGDTAV
jgi:hypothetical protein